MRLLLTLAWLIPLGISSESSVATKVRLRLFASGSDENGRQAEVAGEPSCVISRNLAVGSDSVLWKPEGFGWQVPAYTLTGTASGIPVQRILVRLGVSRDMAALLLKDFRDAVAHFTKHPVTVSMPKEESGGFSHL